MDIKLHEITVKEIFDGYEDKVMIMVLLVIMEN